MSVLLSAQFDAQFDAQFGVQFDAQFVDEHAAAMKRCNGSLWPSTQTELP